MVPPGDFIPLAEELGLIEAIGDWVVNELVYQAKAWRELGIDLEIGFNLSPRQFWQPDLAERILSRIRDGGIDPARIVVEVTESSAMIDPDRAQEILWELHRGGLRIAIDDFGTGYSSLSRLRDVPVDVLKIDRSFVSGVDDDPQAASIVAAFIELASGLGMMTLAEGIETPGELAFLVARGCRMGQGFLFSRPVPPEEIIALALAGVPAVARGVRESARQSSATRTRSAIDAESIPAQDRSSSGLPDPGMSATPILTTRPLSAPPAARASSTASPRPPSTR
jgi:EAL domain-containing protein (putative c-di-GMP-specific phosphodiesterase class I)